MTGAAGSCPQCGAPIRFGGATSLVAVCAHCRVASARQGAALVGLGTMPDLVATDSRLELGAQGRLDRHHFRVLGRVQLEQGAAAWDEWYLRFEDGSDGWLSEAQGRLFCTRRAASPGPLPKAASLRAGERVPLGPAEAAVDEVAEARFVSAAGELPFRPQLGATYRFADLSTAAGGFATIDDGDGSEPPELFAGKELTYAEAGLGDRAQASRAQAGPAGVALTCPACGGAIALKTPQGVSITCPSCHGLLDLRAGVLALVAQLQKREPPPVPLGSKGTLDGEPLEVIGYLLRALIDEGHEYRWREYLLHGPAGYRWLSEYDGHFHLLAPVAGGRVKTHGDEASAALDGAAYRHFQTAQAHYRDIQGELTWRARLSDVVTVRDYVAPPRLLCAEATGSELGWTAGRWISGEEVWKGLSLPGAPPSPRGVGQAQPNPHRASLERISTPAALAVALLVLGTIALAATSGRRIASIAVPLTPLDAGVPASGARELEPVVSEPFSIPGPTAALELAVRPDLDNAWLGFDLTLIEEASGEAHGAALEVSQYSGVEAGERWSEGSRSESVILPAVPAGSYVLRVDAEEEASAGGRLPDTVDVVVSRGSLLWLPVVLAFLALILPPLWLAIRAAAFEGRRWAESDHPEGG